MPLFKNLFAGSGKNPLVQQKPIRTQILSDSHTQENLYNKLVEISEQYDISPYFPQKDSLRNDLNYHISCVNLGITGEKNVLNRLHTLGMDGIDMYVIHDISFKTFSKHIQFDFIVITCRHIYILESKYRKDDSTWIIDKHQTVSRKMPDNLTMHENNNPFIQLQDQLATINMLITDDNDLKDLLSEDRIYGTVVFSNPKATFKSEDESLRIVSLAGLYDFIKNKEKNSKLEPFSHETMKKIGNAILSHSSDDTPDYAEKYSAPLNDTSNKNIEPKTSNSNTKNAEYLEKQLRTYRMQKSTEQDILPFLIFHDSTMKELIQKQPKTLDQLAKIHRCGENSNFYKSYGNDILKILNGKPEE